MWDRITYSSHRRSTFPADKFPVLWMLGTFHKQDMPLPWKNNKKNTKLQRKIKHIGDNSLNFNTSLCMLRELFINIGFYNANSPND